MQPLTIDFGQQEGQTNRTKKPMQNKIGTALHAAIVCMPKEICTVIGDYASGRYIWNAKGLNGVVRDNDIGLPTQLSNVGQRSTGIGEAWQTFVSEIPIDEGDDDWTVECPTVTGWIGVGLSTATNNKTSRHDCGYKLMAGATDWILSERNNQWYLSHDRASTPTPAKSIYGQSILRAWFRVDRRTCVVTVRYSSALNVRLMASTSIVVNAPFASLRPCVVAAGMVSPVIRSGAPDPADFPSDVCQEATFLCRQSS